MIHCKLYKTRFSEIGFTLNSPGDWRFVDITDAQDGNKDHMHCVGASYPTKEQLLLNVERYAAEFGCDGANKPNVQTPSDGLLAQIARDHLGIKTLDTYNSDARDFHILAVWNVKAALEAAWKAGVNEERKASQPTALQVNHIDGDPTNNEPENIQLVPTVHSPVSYCQHCGEPISRGELYCGPCDPRE